MYLNTGLVGEELMVARGGGGWLKEINPCPLRPNGRTATFLRLKWGELKVKGWAV